MAATLPCVLTCGPWRKWHNLSDFASHVPTYERTHGTCRNCRNWHAWSNAVWHNWHSWIDFANLRTYVRQCACKRTYGTMRKRHPCGPPAAPALARGTAWLIASGTLGPQDKFFCLRTYARIHSVHGSQSTYVLTCPLGPRFTTDFWQLKCTLLHGTARST